MAVEERRGCGYRTAGGIYLAGSTGQESCDRLPFPLSTCPHCHTGIKQTRGFQWVSIDLVEAAAPTCVKMSNHCWQCLFCGGPLASVLEPNGKVGLFWVGAQFYPTPLDWLLEAQRLGASRRISAIPRDFVIGESWVLAAHPKAFCSPSPGEEPQPGAFYLWKPSRVELIVTPSMKKQKWAQRLFKQGVTPVEVPEDDPDHVPACKARGSARVRAMQKVGRRHRKVPPPLVSFDVVPKLNDTGPLWPTGNTPGGNGG